MDPAWFPDSYTPELYGVLQLSIKYKERVPAIHPNRARGIGTTSTTAMISHVLAALEYPGPFVPALVAVQKTTKVEPDVTPGAFDNFLQRPSREVLLLQVENSDPHSAACGAVTFNSWTTLGRQQSSVGGMSRIGCARMHTSGVPGTIALHVR
eukprot:3941899-Rhodomonas_salina.5